MHRSLAFRSALCKAEVISVLIRRSLDMVGLIRIRTGCVPSKFSTEIAVNSQMYMCVCVCWYVYMVDSEDSRWETRSSDFISVSALGPACEMSTCVVNWNAFYSTSTDSAAANALSLYPYLKVDVSHRPTTIKSWLYCRQNGSYFVRLNTAQLFTALSRWKYQTLSRMRPAWEGGRFLQL